MIDFDSFMQSHDNHGHLTVTIDCGASLFVIHAALCCPSIPQRRRGRHSLRQAAKGSAARRPWRDVNETGLPTTVRRIVPHERLELLALGKEFARSTQYKDCYWQAAAGRGIRRYYLWPQFMITLNAGIIFNAYSHHNSSNKRNDMCSLPLQFAAPRATAAFTRRPLSVEQFFTGQSGRDELEAFIAHSFHQTYDAEVKHFCDVLLGFRGEDGSWAAALGYTLAANSRTFLEQYLDLPLEQAISRQAGTPVARSDIVEVGNLAATHPGAARTLIVSTTRLLHGLGLRWVAFTATASLLNSFSRLRLQPQLLAMADPARLADGGKHWGRYYDTQPHVMFGNIGYGYAQLS